MGNCYGRPAIAHASSTHFSAHSGTLISHTFLLVFYFAFFDGISFPFSFVDFLVLYGLSSFCV